MDDMCMVLLARVHGYGDLKLNFKGLRLMPPAQKWNYQESNILFREPGDGFSL